jgi:hypothetical protein
LESYLPSNLGIFLHISPQFLGPLQSREMPSFFVFSIKDEIVVFADCGLDGGEDFMREPGDAQGFLDGGEGGRGDDAELAVGIDTMWKALGEPV